LLCPELGWIVSSDWSRLFLYRGSVSLSSCFWYFGSWDLVLGRDVSPLLSHCVVSRLWLSHLECWSCRRWRDRDRRFNARFGLASLARVGLDRVCCSCGVLDDVQFVHWFDGMARENVVTGIDGLLSMYCYWIHNCLCCEHDT
jgi:hypothetical protein